MMVPDTSKNCEEEISGNQLTEGSVDEEDGPAILSYTGGIGDCLT